MADLLDPKGEDKRIALLLDQYVIQGNIDLAREIEHAGHPEKFAIHDIIIKEGDYSDDIYFIIRGSVAIQSNGHNHNIRKHRCHIGEIAFVDPGHCRSANVVCNCDGTVAIRVPGDDMRRIANKYPEFWRHLLREVSDRLRERDRFFVRPNEKSIVFIASSGAAKEDLDTFCDALSGVDIVCKPWTDPDIFSASDFTINSLIKQADQVDFAVILATPDDLIVKNHASKSKSKIMQSARDNVILEYGLFAGAIDRNRVFVLEKTGVNLPTDLQGLTTLRYSEADDLLAHAANLKISIHDKGPFVRMKRLRDT